MAITNYLVSVTTNSSGAFTGYTPMPVSGRLEHIRYIPDASTPLDTGAGITVTGETSTIPIVTKTSIGTSAFTLAPRQATHNVSDGSAALYAAAGSGVLDKIAFAGERLKVVVASGGNTKSGVFEILVSDR